MNYPISSDASTVCAPEGESLPSGVGARIQASADQVRQAGEWMLRSHPSELVERLVSQAMRIGTLYERLEQASEQLEQAQAQIQTLENKVAELERAGKRQAAPFRRAASKKKRAPKRPGRAVGHKGSWRKRPDTDEVDRHIEVPLSVCPACGESLEESEQRPIEQTIVELPPITPEVIRLRTYRQTCPCCAESVSSGHPLQVSKATGAAGTHLGPRALGVMASLHHQSGVSLRNCCQILERLMGLKISPGGLSQALGRMASRLNDDYDQLLEHLQSQEVLHLDETGWWVGGPGYWLWVVTNDAGTYYRVVPHRNRDTAKSLIGESFSGVLVSDCLNIYDGVETKQHKCYAHHLKAISAALDTPAGAGSMYLLELRGLLHTALLLKQKQPDLQPELITDVRQWLEQRAEALLATPRGDPDDLQRQQEEALRARLAKQRSHLFTFLDHEAVEATNNRAERQLRPAVIRRKISCGNKSETGAHTWEILSSLAATDTQRGDSFIDHVANAMRLDSPA